MATTENLVVSSPSFAAEHAAVNRVMDKDRKKQQKEIAHLATLLKVIEEELAGAKEGVSTQSNEKIVELNANASEGPSSNAFDEAMAKMALALQLLQVNIAKFDDKKAGFDANISQAQVRLTQEKLHDLEKKLKKIQKQEEKRKTMGFWEKVADIAIAVVSAAVALATLQPELLIMTAVSLLSATGLFEDATKGLATLFEDMGLSSEVSEILAAVVVCVAVIAATAYVDPEEIAQEGVATGEDITSTVEEASTSIEETGETAEETSNTVKQGLLKKINLFNRLGKKTNLIIFNAINTIASTQLVNKVAAEGMDLAHTSEKKKKETQFILSIIMAIMTIIVSMGTGMAVMGNAAANVDRSANSTLVRLVSASKYALAMGAFAEAGAGVSEGTFTIQQGKMEADFAKINGELELIRTAMKMNANETTEDQRHDADTIKQQKIGDNSLSHLMQGEAAFAQLFTGYSPV